jgi:hypothetical protein
LTLSFQNGPNHHHIAKVALPVAVAAGAKIDDPPVAATAGEAVVAPKIELAAAGIELAAPGFVVPPNIPEPLASFVVVAAALKTEPNCKITG